MQIELLQKELECQTVVRTTLEKAFNHQPIFDDPSYKSLSQVTQLFLFFLFEFFYYLCA